MYFFLILEQTGERLRLEFGLKPCLDRDRDRDLDLVVLILVLVLILIVIVILILVLILVLVLNRDGQRGCCPWHRYCVRS